MAVVVVNMLRMNSGDAKLKELEGAVKFVMAEASKRLVMPTPWPCNWNPDKVVQDAKTFVDKNK